VGKQKERNLRSLGRELDFNEGKKTKRRGRKREREKRRKSSDLQGRLRGGSTTETRIVKGIEPKKKSLERERDGQEKKRVAVGLRALITAGPGSRTSSQVAQTTRPREKGRQRQGLSRE